jgi:exosortase A-associated hydrolase 2
MHEDYLFLEINGERIFVGHHRPARPASRAIVMCHPLAEEKLWAHRVFVSFARDLSVAGFDVLRFDFRGEGDSDRDFEQTDLETRIEDATRAIDAVHEMNPFITEITLLGLRLGANVAAATAARRSDVDRLVLWDPVVDGSAYIQNVLRLNLMFQMALHRKVIENRDMLVARLAAGDTVNIEGYELNEALFRQVSQLRLADTLSRFRGKTLVAQIHQGTSQAKADLVELAASDGHVHLEAVQEETFWKEIKTFCRRSVALTATTQAWLAQSA